MPFHASRKMAVPRNDQSSLGFCRTEEVEPSANRAVVKKSGRTSAADGRWSVVNGTGRRPVDGRLVIGSLTIDGPSTRTIDYRLLFLSIDPRTRQLVRGARARGSKEQLPAVGKC